MAQRQMVLRRMAPRRMALRRMALRRMALRRRKAETEGPETDDPETDGPETDGPETDVPETEESRDGGRPTGMSPTLKVCFSNILEGFRGCYCLIKFEWCVCLQRCVSLVDDSSGVCVGVWEWLAGCVLVRVQERVAERSCVLVG